MDSLVKKVKEADAGTLCMFEKPGKDFLDELLDPGKVALGTSFLHEVQPLEPICLYHKLSHRARAQFHEEERLLQQLRFALRSSVEAPQEALGDPSSVAPTRHVG